MLNLDNMFQIDQLLLALQIMGKGMAGIFIVIFIIIGTIYLLRFLDKIFDKSKEKN